MPWGYASDRFLHSKRENQRERESKRLPCISQKKEEKKERERERVDTDKKEEK